MKRVYLILTLFMTSFFFFSLEKVSAETKSYEISDTEYQYINNNFFELRNYVISNLGNYEPYYIIYYENNKYYVWFFKTDGVQFLQNSTTIYLDKYMTSYRYYLNNGTLSGPQINNARTLQFISNDTLSYAYFLDTNMTMVPYKGTDSFNIKYKNSNYLIESGANIPTLYSIYLDSNISDSDDTQDDKFIEEKEVMNNFYSMIFTKIADLSNNFTNNYTFLIILGIFILIFIVDLIKRWLL